MQNIIQKFKDDPQFAITVIAIAAPVAIAVISGVPKLIESSAYAYRASKL